MRKYLTVLIAAALVAVVVLLQQPAKAECPTCNRQSPQVVYGAPRGLYWTPVREGLRRALTPRFMWQPGYYVLPTPPTPHVAYPAR